jgi:hypothetical protein
MTCEKFEFMTSLHIGLVEHHWTGSYLRKPYGAHYRKYLRILSKKVLKTTSDWTGIDVWCSPIVPLAPPYPST